ncbi:MAG: NAD(+) diphosphatase [Clostridiales bacterium]|nr:NAD(+) diphosphatase [Clostridiales bacterium]
MIQDIAPHIYDNAYRPEKTPTPLSYALCYADRRILISRGKDAFDLPRFQDLERENPDIYEHVTYLFTIDEQDFFLVEHITVPAPSRFFMENTQVFRGAKPRHLAFAAITGWQLNRWYQSHRYCGRCGRPMRKHDKERMMYCDNCHQTEYPKICPAVIVGITDGNRLLLSKYAPTPEHPGTRYSLIAGFTEIGETFEETVKREVMEEVGLKVKNIRYYKSQPWSFSDSILAGFYCDLDSSDKITLDRNELALAQWFEREDIPQEDAEHATLTMEMIQAFRTGKA